MSDVSIARLYALRAVYLLIAVGLGLQVWPAVLAGIDGMELQHGTVTAMLWALSILALLGLRYPLQMLPLIFFEMVWKGMWLLSVGLPKWLNGTMDYWTEQTAIACLMGVIFPLVLPWKYVIRTYVTRPGDPWRPRRSAP